MPAVAATGAGLYCLGAQTPCWCTIARGLEWGGNQGGTAKGLYYGFTLGAVYSA